MRWAGHVAHTGDRKDAKKAVWWVDLRQRVYLEDLCIYGMIKRKCIFKKQQGEAWAGLIWLIIGQMVGSWECGNEP